MAQHSLQNKGHATLSSVNVIFMPVPCSSHEFFFTQVLYPFIFCRLIAGSLMAFSAISRVSLFEVDDDTCIRGRAAFQRFASTNAKHYVFCVSDMKNA